MISEPQNVLFSSYASEEVSRNLNSTNPQAAELPQEKQEEKLEDSVKITISSEASDLLEQMEGESVAVANSDSGQETSAKEDNAFREAEQLTIESNLRAQESAQKVDEDTLQQLVELMTGGFDTGSDSSQLVNILA